jgi:hypothetical protein
MCITCPEYLAPYLSTAHVFLREEPDEDDGDEDDDGNKDDDNSDDGEDGEEGDDDGYSP